MSPITPIPGAKQYFEYVPELAAGWGLGHFHENTINSKSDQTSATGNKSKVDIAKVALNYIFNGGSSLLNLFTFFNANLFHFEDFQERLESASDTLTRAACGVQGAVLSIDAWRKKNIISLIGNASDLPIVSFSSNNDIWFNRGWSQGISQCEAMVNDYVLDGKKLSADFSQDGWAKGFTTTISTFGSIIKDLVKKPSSFHGPSHSLLVASIGQITGTLMGWAGSTLAGPLIRDTFGTIVDYALMKRKKWSLLFLAGFTWVGAAVADALKRFDGINQSIKCLTNLSFASDRGASVLYTRGYLIEINKGLEKENTNAETEQTSTEKNPEEDIVTAEKLKKNLAYPKTTFDDIPKEVLQSRLALRSSCYAIGHRFSDKYHPIIESRVDAFDALSDQLTLAKYSYPPENEQREKINSFHSKLSKIYNNGLRTFNNTWDRDINFRSDYQKWHDYFTYDAKEVEKQITKEEWDALFKETKNGKIDLRIVVHAACKEVFSVDPIKEAVREGKIDEEELNNILGEYTQNKNNPFFTSQWDMVQPMELSSDESRRIFEEELKNMYHLEPNQVTTIQNVFSGKSKEELPIGDIFTAYKLNHVSKDQLLEVAKKRSLKIEDFLQACRFGLYEQNTILENVENGIFSLEESRKHRGSFSRKKYNTLVKRLYTEEDIEAIKAKLSLKTTNKPTDDVISKVTYEQIIEAADANLGGIVWSDVVNFVNSNHDCMNFIEKQRKAIPLTNHAYITAYRAAGGKELPDIIPEPIVKLLREEDENSITLKMREGINITTIPPISFAQWNTQQIAV